MSQANAAQELGVQVNNDVWEPEAHAKGNEDIIVGAVVFAFAGEGLLSHFPIAVHDVFHGHAPGLNNQLLFGAIIVLQSRSCGHKVLSKSNRSDQKGEVVIEDDINKG